MPITIPLSIIPWDFRRLTAVLAVGLFALAASGCATTGAVDDQPSPNADMTTNGPEGTYDPLQGVNRVVFKFNDKFDRFVAKPVAKGYRAITPRPVRRGVSNFFDNLYQPIVIVNETLQGKFKAAASDVGRFLTNSTIGVLGLFDVASKFGMEQHNEDFGQTLGVWGVKEGPYLVLPFFGPSNLRDGVGLVGDYATHPITYMDDQSTASKLTTGRIIDARYRLLEAGDILDEAAGDDPYVFVREAFLQRRRSLVSDGAAEGPAQVDPSIFEDEKPAEKPAPNPTEKPK